MSNNKKSQILQYIKEKKSLDGILNNRFSYIQLIKELRSLQNDEFITYKEERFFLTDKGEIYLKEKSFCKIEPLKEYQCEKISIDDFYIPSYIIEEYERTKN